MGKSAQSTHLAQRALRRIFVLFVLFVLGFGFTGALSAQTPGSLADAEKARRLAGVEEAEMLLQKGDESYRAGNFADAAEAYAGARELLPDAPLTAELRRAATDRFSQASIEHGRSLARKGDLVAAGAAVDRVLSKDVAPNDPAALAFRAHLDDPIRTNPALDAAHALDVDQVRRLLYTAEGAFELGKFDEAKKHYESILRIDATNTAARRGLERISQEVGTYARTAQGHTRAELLAEVDKQWELLVPPTYNDVPGGFGRSVATGDTGVADIEVLLDQIRLPQVALFQANISEAVDYLRTVSVVQGAQPQFVNYTLNLGSNESEWGNRIRAMKFDLQLNDVPLRHVLQVITDMTQTTFSTDGYSVTIRPKGSDSNELLERTFRVPPDFLTSLATGTKAPEANDPFAADNKASGPGLLTERMSAQEAFAQQGVGFPEGAFARYLSSTSTLNVRNTANNLDIIQQIVDSITRVEPVMVAVRVTMITTQKHNLEEIGMDWLLTPVAIGDNLFASGGTVGNSPGRRGGDFTSPVNGAVIPGIPLDPNGQVGNLLTNGLRSGDYQTTGNSIDQLIADPSRSAQRSSVAPGILSVTGLFTDGQVQTVIRGLSQKKGVDIMAQPSIVTRSNQLADIRIVEEFIYPTDYEAPEIPTSIGNDTGGGPAPVTPASPTDFDMRPVGLELEVLPVADAEKRFVDITLKPSFSKFDGFVNYGSPILSSVTGPLGITTPVEVTQNAILMPVFSVQRTDTQLTVADGSTIVFGGLMTDRIVKGEDKVPILGQLPLFGRLFTSESSQPITTAIIFMVHVELIDPTGRPYRDR